MYSGWWRSERAIDSLQWRHLLCGCNRAHVKLVGSIFRSCPAPAAAPVPVTAIASLGKQAGTAAVDCQARSSIEQRWRTVNSCLAETVKRYWDDLWNSYRGNPGRSERQPRWDLHDPLVRTHSCRAVHVQFTHFECAPSHTRVTLQYADSASLRE